jgi:hypothetical protein
MNNTTFILTFLINQIVTSMKIEIKLTLSNSLYPPYKNNNYLIRAGCNIHGILYIISQPASLYKFSIHVDNKNNAKSIILLPFSKLINK